jgi:outer membrane protein assembly factor BamB
MRAASTPIACAAAVIIVLAACGGGRPGLSLTYPDNQADQLATVLARIDAAPPVSTRPVALGVAPSAIFAVELTSGQVLWTVPSATQVVPYAAGDLVISQEPERGIVARALDTGDEQFALADDALHLAGADGEGRFTAIALSTGGGVQARSRLVVAMNGRVDWELESEHPFGRLAVRAGMIFLPWGHQNLSVLDAESGQELARLRIGDDVLGSAIVRSGAVYVGENSVFRIDARATGGSRSAIDGFTPDLGTLPGQPPFMSRGYEPPPSPRGAAHRVRLEWRPTTELAPGAVALEGAHVYLVFYRLVFALDAASGTMAWAHAHPRDIVGAVAQPGGLLVADDGGTFAFLEGTTGAERWTQRADVEPVAVRFRAVDFAPGENDAGARPALAAQSLADQLLAAARHGDARLTPVRVMATQQLGRLEASEVTAHLIALCDPPGGPESIPDAVRATACNAIADQTDGADAVLAALSRRASFLEGSRPPPVEVLARAAVRMSERRAAPLLVEHLRDPSTSSDALAGVLAALGALGEVNAAPAIAEFLRLYHADEEDEPMIAAMGAAARALVALKGSDAHPTLQAIVDDPMGIGPVRGLCRAALEPEPAAADASAEDERAPGADDAPDDGSSRRDTP